MQSYDLRKVLRSDRPNRYYVNGCRVDATRYDDLLNAGLRSGFYENSGTTFTNMKDGSTKRVMFVTVRA